MKRYEQLKKIYFSLMEEKSHGYFKKEGYEHTFGVIHMSLLLSSIRHLDAELCAIIALFHDISTAIYASSFDHASRSAHILSSYLEDFDEKEKEIILTSIRNHSLKDQIGHAYEECIKDADIYQRYLLDSTYQEHSQRIEKVKNEIKGLSS